MADDILENPLKLTPDMQKKLEDMDGDITKGQAAIDGLKELGLDTSDLDDKLEWAKKTRETLLKRFSK